MEYEKYENGVPSWVDVGVTDLPKARTFYSGLFGWDIEEGPPEAGGYSIAMLNGKSVCGIGPQMNPEAPSAWMTYVNVDSADDTTAKAKAAGATVFVEPMDVMDVGRMAIFADSQGAVIGLWQPGTHMGAQLVNEPGTYCWSELITNDIDAAKAFYKAVFSWGAENAGGAEPPDYVEWKLDGQSMGGMMKKTPEMPPDMPPNWGIYFAVADCDASAAKVKELGGAVFMGPQDIEPGRFAVCSDDQGVMFNVLALKEMPS